MELGEIYRGTRRRVVALVGGLSGEDAARVAPATPQWSVHDIVAHLAGLTTDVLSGNIEGAGTDPWTAKQVSDRSTRSMAELLAEWDANAPTFEPMVDTIPQMARTAMDVLVHEHDIRGALQLRGPSDAEMVDYVLQRSVAFLGERIPVAVRITAGTTEWIVGPGKPAASVSTDGFELFRALFGRRSVGQVAGWDWDGDPSPYLDVLSVFGPLPDLDVLEP